MSPYQPCGATSHGGEPCHLLLFILAIYIVLRTTSCLCPRTSRMALRHPASASFAFKKKKNTLCTSCSHSLRVVLNTKCFTVTALTTLSCNGCLRQAALSCTRIPMRRASLPGCW